MGETFKQQADGQDGHEGEGNPMGGATGAGDGGGGAYPNPHSGKDGSKKDGPDDGFFGHGGQTDIAEKDSGGTPKT